MYSNQSLEEIEQERRIKLALGLENSPLPNVGIELLRKYYKFLAANLTFPFEAQHTEEIGFYRQPSYAQVSVTGILDPDINPKQEFHGLISKAIKSGQEINVPLVDLEVDEENPNFRFIEDYWYWIWNWRFDPHI